MWNEILLAAAAIGSPLAAFAAVYYKRKQPELDQAQAAHQLISSDAVKNEIERSSRELNAARDLRVLDLERWADKMRGVIWRIKARDDVMCQLIKIAYEQMNLPVPDIPDFPEVPEFPAPRPLA